MEYLELSKNEFNGTNILSEGYESKIYVYNSNNREILIKKYFDSDQIDVDKIKLVNELKTGILIKPDKLVKVDNEIVGFSMKYMKKFYPICIMKDIMSEEEKYNLLMNLKEEIINLKHQNCIYADLNVKNIITDGNKVYLCDAVNVKIENYDFDQISSTMKKYYNLKDTFDGIECYMLNLLTIYLFNDIPYENITETIETTLTSIFNNQNYIDYKAITDNEECMNLCYEMIIEKPTKEFLIDNMTIEKEKTL